MNPLISILRFFYRIKYWLILMPIITTGLVFFFTTHLPTTYQANTTIYTGIASAPDINGEASSSKSSANSGFDNIIYLVHSRSFLEKLSLRLLARTLVNGDVKQNTKFINSGHYSAFLNIVPKDIHKITDKKSEENTYLNLVKYKKENKDNFIFSLLNWSHPYFSIAALDKIEVKRLGNSDMLEITYRCDDPGVVYQTIDILNDELIVAYSYFQLGSSTTVTDYFKTQLDSIRSNLKVQEDSLVEFSKSKNIVNYEMQAQMMVERLGVIDTKYEDASMDYATSKQMISNLEVRLAKRAGIMKNNQDFLETLSTVSLLSKKIANIEIESVGDDAGAEDQDKLPTYKDALSKSEKKLYDVANNINETLYTKDGMVLNDLVREWLAEVLKNEKSKAEMDILAKKKKELEAEYFQYTPVGPELKRQEREIGVTEESYHMLLGHLAQAKLQQKNFQMKSSNLNIVTPPVYPISFVESKRKSLILLTFAGTLIFILGCFLILEMLDKTVRDKYRAIMLSKAPVIGAFPGPLHLKQRSFMKEIDRIASAYVCNRLMYLQEPGKVNVVNLISKEAGEGRSRIAENLKAHWEEQHFNVRVVSYHEDFNANDKSYHQAKSIRDLVDLGETQPDFVIVEHAPLLQQSINKSILTEAFSNLYIIRTTRAWSESDPLFFKDIQSYGAATYLLLSKARLFAVEDFTGMLPTASKLKKWVHKIMQLELSSSNEQNLEKSVLKNGKNNT
jgi:uncharacterized protein involved in exopolysaccharide biosynthesis